MSLKRLIRIFALIQVLISGYFSYANSFFELNKEEKGWLWYEGLKKHDEAEKKEIPKQNLEKAASDARKRIEQIKKALEKALDIAIDNPTLENVIRAQRMQKLVMDKSEIFGKQWVRAALVDYKLYSDEENPNQLHRKALKVNKEEMQDTVLKEMAQNFGLFLYVKEGCRYCEIFSPIVEQLSKETDFQVLAISRSGQNFGPFEGAKDTGLLDWLNPRKASPVLFLVSRDGSQVQVVARGLTDLDTLKENIFQIRKFLQ
jgi:conjugal transfer pilus assembly protein TraF